jgi:hypothetical protein
MNSSRTHHLRKTAVPTRREIGTEWNNCHVCWGSYTCRLCWLLLLLSSILQHLLNEVLLLWSKSLHSTRILLRLPSLRVVSLITSRCQWYSLCLLTIGNLLRVAKHFFQKLILRNRLTLYWLRLRILTNWWSLIWIYIEATSAIHRSWC